VRFAVPRRGQPVASGGRRAVRVQCCTGSLPPVRAIPRRCHVQRPRWVQAGLTLCAASASWQGLAVVHARCRISASLREPVSRLASMQAWRGLLRSCLASWHAAPAVGCARNARQGLACATGSLPVDKRLAPATACSTPRDWSDLGLSVLHRACSHGRAPTLQLIRVAPCAHIGRGAPRNVCAQGGLQLFLPCCIGGVGPVQIAICGGSAHCRCIARLDSAA